jgi:hypothetical protein
MMFVLCMGLGGVIISAALVTIGYGWGYWTMQGRALRILEAQRRCRAIREEDDET